jgi:hypothetical protein
MAKTRATKSSSKSTSEETSDTAKANTQKRQLAPESSNPPKIFILPKDTTPEARIVILQNPRYQTDSRFFICPSKGIYEFTKISAPKTTPRSWLLSPQQQDTESQDNASEDEKGEDISKGYVLKSADLLLATSYDPLFLVLPVLYPQPTKTSSESTKQLFLSSEDYFDRMISVSPHLRTLISTPSVRSMFEARMAAVSDTVDAGDEVMYRMNNTKLFSVLWSKAQKMVEKGLPESMEEKFIRKALEVPILCLKRDESYHDELRKAEEEAEKAVSTPSKQTAESQESQSSVGSISTAATSFCSESSFSAKEAPTSLLKASKPQISAPPGIPHLLRLKTAFQFLLSSYIPLHIHTPLLTLLTTSPSIIDLTPLTAHLTHLAALRKEALAARSLNEVSGNKRRMEDELEDEERNEKRRKKEEDEKRKKAGESRGVKNLKKVNVSGMKKMSDFFKKK